MEKKRIYQVAKEFHVSSEALISMLSDMSYEIKSHMSVVEPDMYQKISDQFTKQHDQAIKDIQKRNMISEAIDKQTTEKIEPEKKVEKPIEKKDTRKKPPRKPVRVHEKEVPTSLKVIAKKKETKESEEKDKTSKKRSERRSRAKARRQKLKEHQADVQKTFKKTMASITDTSAKTKKYRSKQSQRPDEVEEVPTVRVTEFMSVAELAIQMGVPASGVVAKCMGMGMIVNINQRLDLDTITLLADEFGFEVKLLGEYGEDVLKARDDEELEEERCEARPPVVTVMGHVDHGKTSLLDKIRQSDVVSGESGGITQHIGAYSVKLADGHHITFIDTPGHEAFTAMRARGAKVTDIVILIVAANDSVMPQTVEAIDHAKAAGVPIVIAINKIDLPDSDPERIRSDLSRHNILVEDWGGSYQCQEISAKKNVNIDKLLDKVLLESELLELKTNYDKSASGVVIDSKLDRGRGPIATVLIQSGSLHVGDSFISGMITGRVRAMMNEKGQQLEIAGPSEPVQLFGMTGVPKAGDTFYVVQNESEAKDIAQHRKMMRREQDFRRAKPVTLDDLYSRIKEGTIRELKLIIKADVDGSVEAVSDSLTNITHEEVRVSVIHRGVGGINENDVLLAAASDAIIIGFHVRPTPEARNLAERENVDIKLYEVIYEAIEDVQKALSGLLAPRVSDKTVGTAEIRDVFRVPKAGNIAGCYVTSGTLRRNARAKLIRDNVVIYDSTISSLKRFKEDTTEVNSGYECGLKIEGYDDYKVGDMVEVVVSVEEARTI